MKKSLLYSVKSLLAFSLLLLCLTRPVLSQSQTVANLYENVSNSVVVIITSEKSPDKEDNELKTSLGLGSGVLISEEGHILTAEHVVGLADEIIVQFPNDELINARVLKSSFLADIALIQLEYMPQEYTVAKLANSDSVRIGEQVIVIGAPLQLDQSLSVGYVSGRKKDYTFTNSIVIAEYFQTDASINPGNSGGPMFNMQGEVIGIVSFILTESGGFEGIGFAATANMAKRLMESKSTWAGIEGHLLNAELCQFFNVPQKGAVLVQRLAQDSPLRRVGLKAGYKTINIDEEELIIGGDILLSVADIPMINPEAFLKIQSKIQTAKESVPIKVLRAGEIITLELYLP